MSFRLPLFLFTLTLYLRTSFAADCWGSTGVDPNDSKQSAWDLRDAVCGHNACAASDAEQGNNHYCTISQPFGETGAVTIQRHDSSGNFPNCYDALENIINQCFSDQSASFDPSSSPNGRWTIGDEWYWITMDYEEPAPSGDEVDVDDGRSDTSGTLMGPSQFCQGLSPGGGSSCIQVPDGCYIDVPLDNTVPDVQCDL
ncbi:MAG: hypothetical protein Q9190_005557 [Brigantiaea leucoxantha]